MIHNTVEVVSIKHYSGPASIKCIVLENTEEYIQIKLTKEFAVFNFFEGDPIVLGYEIGSDIFIGEGSILLINSRNNAIKIQVPDVRMITDKRLAERFPVSIYADIKDQRTKKREVVIIKDISLQGMGMMSKVEFSEDDIIEFDAYFGQLVVPLKACILRKQKIADTYHYGTQTIYNDFNSKNTIKLNLQIIKDNMEKMMKELKNK